jgi:hypothetical protein
MSDNPLHSKVVEITRCDIAEVKIDELRNHRALYSTKGFHPDELMIAFAAGVVHESPNYLTVQVNDGEHIELSPEYLECTNHSCDPNCFFDTMRYQLIALRKIEIGDELTFFYPSTEWDMDRSFKCHCGSQCCIGLIQGARYLSREVVKRYRFTDYIHKKLIAAGLQEIHKSA